MSNTCRRSLPLVGAAMAVPQAVQRAAREVPAMRGDPRHLARGRGRVPRRHPGTGRGCRGGGGARISYWSKRDRTRAGASGGALLGRPRWNRRRSRGSRSATSPLATPESSSRRPRGSFGTGQGQGDQPPLRPARVCRTPAACGHAQELQRLRGKLRRGEVATAGRERPQARGAQAMSDLVHVHLGFHDAPCGAACAFRRRRLRFSA
jgi:hypothetical protein